MTETNASPNQDDLAAVESWGQIYKQLTAIDFGVMALYVVTLVALGAWISFRKKREGHLFLAQKSLGWCSIGFSMWGTNVGPSMLIASTSITTQPSGHSASGTSS